MQGNMFNCKRYNAQITGRGFFFEKILMYEQSYYLRLQPDHFSLKKPSLISSSSSFIEDLSKRFLLKILRFDFVKITSDLT